MKLQNMFHSVFLTIRLLWIKSAAALTRSIHPINCRFSYRFSLVEVIKEDVLHSLSFRCSPLNRRYRMHTHTASLCNVLQYLQISFAFNMKPNFRWHKAFKEFLRMMLEIIHIHPYVHVWDTEPSTLKWPFTSFVNSGHSVLPAQHWTTYPACDIPAHSLQLSRCSDVSI